VEVRPGQPPGMKYRPPSVKIDYRRWNEEKLQGLLADPAAAMQDVVKQLDFYIKKIDEALSLYTEYNAKLKQEREKQDEMIRAGKLDKAQAFEGEVVSPLAVQTSNLVLNYRYYAVAALSLRRYVGGRMYLFLKAGRIREPADPSLLAFQEKYQQMLASFEEHIVPRLLDVDI
jgi:hypothetical protein